MKLAWYTQEHGIYVANMMKQYDLGVWTFNVTSQSFRIEGQRDTKTITASAAVLRLQDAISAHISRGMDDHVWLNKNVFDKDERAWEAWSVHIQEIQYAMDQVWPGVPDQLTDGEIKDVVDFFKESLSSASNDWDTWLEGAVRNVIDRPGWHRVSNEMLDPEQEDK